MKTSTNKAFWGLLLLLTAISLILYGAGLGADIFGLPLYKLILGLVLLAWIVSKVIFGEGIREKFRIFTLLSFLFMLLETEISNWANMTDENIINNWLLLLAGIIADIAIGMLLPKGKKKKHLNFKINDGDIHIGNCDETEHTFSNVTHFPDASKDKYHYYMNKMGNMHIYYQNTDLVADGEVLELELECKMGNIVVHLPDDWEVYNEIHTNMGNTHVRGNNGSRVKLTLKGRNSMGNIRIES